MCLWHTEGAARPARGISESRKPQGRWRSLKLPFEYHSYERVSSHVLMCVILHNMIMHHDGLNLSKWGDVAAWEAVSSQPVAHAHRR